MSQVRLDIDQPAQSLAGRGFVSAARRAFLATRPAFLVASILPVLVGTAWANAAFHQFDGLSFGLALAAIVFAQAATNVYNDVSDDQLGADVGNTERIYPYTGGSRFIQAGLLSRHEMMRLALGLCAVAVLLGAVLAYQRGPGVILLGLVGLGLGLLYSLPGAQLSARGVGEAAVGLGLGVLPVLGAVWLQTGGIDSGALLICIPVTCWVTAILIINEVPDMEADSRAHKRTLVVRWGVSGARLLYRGLTIISLLAIVAAIALHVLPIWFAAPALALGGLSWAAAQRISADKLARPRLKQGIELTLAVQAVGCVAVSGALLLERFL